MCFEKWDDINNVDICVTKMRKHYVLILRHNTLWKRYGRSVVELLLYAATRAPWIWLPLDTQGWIQLNRKGEVVTKVKVIS